MSERPGRGKTAPALACFGIVNFFPLLPQKLLITGPNGEKIPLISRHDLFDFFAKTGKPTRRAQSVGMHAHACGLLSSSHRCCGVRETIQRLATGGWSRNAVWDRLPSSLWSPEAILSRPCG